MDNRDTFSIYFHHGGTFLLIGTEMTYVGGGITARHDIDIDRFGYLDLEEEVVKLGYSEWDKLLFRMPGAEGRYEYKNLHNDHGVMEMINIMLKGFESVDVYLDCGQKIMQTLGDENEQSFYVPHGEENWSNESEKAVSQHEASDSLSEEDEDYHPVEESDTDDGLSDHELASDDEEYVQARKNKAKYKRSDLVNEEVNFSNMHCALQSNNDVVAHYGNNNDSQEREMQPKYRNRVIYDPRCDHKTLTFVLGMRFDSGLQCKDAIQKHAVLNGHDIQFMRSNSDQVEAMCVEGCPWRLYGSNIYAEGTFAIKSLISGHNCYRDMSTRQANAKWVAKEFIHKFRLNPNLKIQDLDAEIQRDYCVNVSKWKLYRGKWKALEMLRGSVTDHYASLRSYMAELMRVDREGRFEFLLGNDSVFKCLFVGFSSLKKGFLTGCRPIIGFDGCFLKTFLGGALLCATGKDGNNQMFPIAWAVVESENENCWRWFLNILFEELGISDGLGWTFISDQQKGLMNAIRDLTPLAEHRNCARHIYCNWKKDNKGKALKNIYWRAVRSTYEAAYRIALEDMKAENEAAYNDFLERDPKRFCKAFITSISRCDMIDNNISESFNGSIVKARGKPIIDMLEAIRTELMERQHAKLQEMSGVIDTITPKIRRKLEQIKYSSRMCHTKPAVGDKFQVSFEDDQFVVDLQYHTCTCRSWDITGIPCIHACSAIQFMRMDTADFVDPFFSVQNYIECYRHALEPLNGRKMWPLASGNPIQPPPYRKMPGRPKKKRRRAPDEERRSATKLKRIGVQMTCQRCLQVGHNQRSCKNVRVERAPKVKGKRGRPPKTSSPANASSEALSGQTAITGRGTPTNASSSKTGISIRTKMVAKRGVRAGQVNQQIRSSSAKERVKARQGIGVTVMEETGNIYMKMSSDKRVYFVNGSRNATQSASTRGGGGAFGRGGSNGRGGTFGRGGGSKSINDTSTSNYDGITNNIGAQESAAP